MLTGFIVDVWFIRRTSGSVLAQGLKLELGPVEILMSCGRWLDRDRNSLGGDCDALYSVICEAIPKIDRAAPLIDRSRTFLSQKDREARASESKMSDWDPDPDLESN